MCQSTASSTCDMERSSRNGAIRMYCRRCCRASMVCTAVLLHVVASLAGYAVRRVVEGFNIKKWLFANRNGNTFFCRLVVWSFSFFVLWQRRRVDAFVHRVCVEDTYVCISTTTVVVLTTSCEQSNCRYPISGMYIVGWMCM